MQTLSFAVVDPVRSLIIFFYGILLKMFNQRQKIINYLEKEGIFVYSLGKFFMVYDTLILIHISKKKMYLLKELFSHAISVVPQLELVLSCL